MEPVSANQEDPPPFAPSTETPSLLNPCFSPPPASFWELRVAALAEGAGTQDPRPGVGGAGIKLEPSGQGGGAE